MSIQSKDDDEYRSIAISIEIKASILHARILLSSLLLQIGFSGLLRLVSDRRYVEVHFYPSFEIP